MSHTEAALRPSGVALRGLVDNFAEGRLHGWAWNPARPGERLRIVLRRGRDAVTETLADGERPDLAAAGIGDGRHAFTLALPPGAAGRLGELALFACAADGSEAPLPIRGARPAARPPAGESTTGNAELLARIDVLEAWCRRLDARLAVAPAAPPERMTRHLDAWQVVLGGLLGAVGAAALAITWFGAARLVGMG
jgi:hypothetical protein